MGVISITQRSERLGNIGSGGMAHGVTSTDIGTVHHTQAAQFSPRFYARNSHGGDAALVSGIGRLGDVAAAISLREDERVCDEIVSRTMFQTDQQDRDEREVVDWNAPGKKHLQGQKRGLLLRWGEGVMNLPEEAESVFAGTFEGVCKGLGASERQQKLAGERLWGYRRARQDRMMDLQAGEYRRMEIGGAEGQLNQFITSWKGGNTGVVGDIFEAREKLGVLQRRTDEQRKADRQGLAVALAKDLAGSQIAKCASADDFDALGKVVKSGNGYPEELRRELPDGNLSADDRKELCESVFREKERFLRRQEAETLAAVDAALNPGRVAALEVCDKDGRIAPDRVERIDRSIGDARKFAATLPKDSKARVRIEYGIAQLTARSEEICRGEFIDEFAKGEKTLDELAKMENPYGKGTRDARCWDAAKAAYRKGVETQYRENRAQTLALSTQAAQGFLAADNPQGYFKWLDDQLDGGRISAEDRQREKEKFTSVWLRSPQMREKAKRMVRVVKDALGVDFGAAFKSDGAGGFDLDANGRLQVQKDAELPEVTYGRKTVKPGRGPYPFERVEVDTERFSGEDFVKIMNHSLQFAAADGLEVKVGDVPDELQWLVTDEERKNGVHRVDCVNDFRAFAERLALEKRVKAIRNRKSVEYLRLEEEWRGLGTSPEEYEAFTNGDYLRRRMR